MSEFIEGEIKAEQSCLNCIDLLSKEDGSIVAQIMECEEDELSGIQFANANEFVRRWNEWSDLKQQRDDLLATVKNALISLAVISMPREDNNVATNSEILKIMGDSFIVAIAKAKV